MTTIQDIFKYRSFTPFKGLVDTEMSKTLLSPERLVGVEIELERVNASYIPTSFNRKEDGSLKINGAEFVSKPITTKYLYLELVSLFKGLKECASSSRCSIHVHVDVRDFTENELHTLLILYSIFERCLFRLSGDRWKSNYCVPVRNNHGILTEFLRKPYQRWYKYQALNLSPIAGGDGSNRQGTVEFRHHQGSNDPIEIMRWVNLVSGLVEYAKHIKLDTLSGILLEANSTSCYTMLTEEVFKSEASRLLMLPTYKNDIEGGITFCKVAFFNHVLKKPKLLPFKETKVVLTPKFNIDLDTAEQMFTTANTADTTGFTIPYVPLVPTPQTQHLAGIDDVLTELEGLFDAEEDI